MQTKKFTIYDIRFTIFSIGNSPRQSFRGSQGRKSAIGNISVSIAVCLIIFAFLLLPSAFGQDRPTEYQVKAVFLEKFCKFVEWPSEQNPESRIQNPALNSQTNAQPATNSLQPAISSAPIIIGVLEGVPDARFLEALQAVAAGDTVDGRRIEVRQIKTLSGLQGCQIVFIPAAAAGRTPAYLAALKQSPVLTVGETDDFYAAGGMIEFVVEDAQVHFRINAAAVRAAGLKISSKLLSLAKP